MNGLGVLQKYYEDLLTAIHFLTRIPVPLPSYRPDSLACSVKFFPLVGLLVGTLAGATNLLVAPHLPRLTTSLMVVIFLMLLTGCLHEDGLADAADGFGGGWDRAQIMRIMRDSRIGTYGAATLTTSLLARIVLLSSITMQEVLAYLITAHVLSRWTALPLGFYLQAASSLDSPTGHPSSDKPSGHQGARIAGTITRSTLVSGTLYSFAIAFIALRSHAFAPIVAAVVVTLLSGFLYRRKLGGATGDCFGATNQLTEIGVYLAGAWTV
ncbi:adenosylcobinamide-GDP ribazoletransferase [Granulicella arctica]|uniref:adenosylcobinamide-GDP ribazoletransferase n=1 Tax=Granulicella arctica TaxID=940613 RepID=UPI0021DF5397|nr:adenosylcobinamide-GDP ribazoletransferase [Granulicella arctica]